MNYIKQFFNVPLSLLFICVLSKQKKKSTWSNFSTGQDQREKETKKILMNPHYSNFGCWWLSMDGTVPSSLNTHDVNANGLKCELTSDIVYVMECQTFTDKISIERRLYGTPVKDLLKSTWKLGHNTSNIPKTDSPTQWRTHLSSIEPYWKCRSLVPFEHRHHAYIACYTLASISKQFAGLRQY